MVEWVCKQMVFEELKYPSQSKHWFTKEKQSEHMQWIGQHQITSH